MNLEQWIPVLETNAKSLQQLTVGVTTEQANFKPDAESWSILHVMLHMYDEERGDFRQRLAKAFGLPDPSVPHDDSPFDESDLTASVQAFLAERQQSITWLRGLNNPDWQASCEVFFGTISAADMMASWVAHDVLHLRQLVELHYALTVQAMAPYQVDYAGDW